jgi:GTP-binding protein
MSRYPQAKFLKSADSAAGFGDDSGAEVAFAGRSNSGKSSAINAIVGRKDLARTSRTPGRTQLVNFFELVPGRRIVDLPGYGYAKVPPKMREHWRRLMEEYFRRRQSLMGLVIVVDTRRGIGEQDEQMLEYAVARGCAVHVLLTKADKLSRADGARALAEANRKLDSRAGVQLFSAESGDGIDSAQGALQTLLARR